MWKLRFGRRRRLVQNAAACVAGATLLGAVAAGGDGGTGGSASGDLFEHARACSVDPSGNVYVIDGGNSRIVKLSPQWEVLQTAGGYGWTDQAFDHPADVTAPNGLDVYVADYGNHRIQRLDRDLSLLSSFSTRDDADASVRFGYPQGVAQSRFGSIFIADGENRRILKVNTSGSVEQEFGDLGAGEGRLSSPSRIRIGGDDRVFVLDSNRIVVFDIFGNFIETLGKGYFNHLRSFTVEGKILFALDSCTLYALNREGGRVRPPVPVVLSAGPALCEAVDIDVQDDRLYLLTEHRVSVERIDVDRLRQEDADK
ncbi:MAG TPA: NHL repeat-containing protein [Bacteroidota bacterium]